MKILALGGAGFFGSHLCDYLLEKGHQVIAMDNLITGNINNIAHVAGNENFKFVKHDVTEYIYIEGDLDYIFHKKSPLDTRQFYWRGENGKFAEGEF